MVLTALSTLPPLPETARYRMKKVLLGPPLITASAGEQKLSKKTALGVLSSDCISSAAYGSEQMLISLLAVFGLAGFHILMPLTAVVLALLVLMTLSYRQVVMVYTKAGGSYVVARENFGPKAAQIASVALLIDYVVTVAVQTAAGTAAITSAVPALATPRTSLAISLTVIALLALGNLRGVREAGRIFALPTYLFVGTVGLIIVAGLTKFLFGTLPTFSTDPAVRDRPNIHLLPITDHHYSILSVVAVFYLAQAFANGGSSLTGLEAISNSVSAFKNPEGVNARKTLTVMSTILGLLVLGISFLAWRTHAAPFADGSPTVISQVAQAALGTTVAGHVGYVAVQSATALILFTGANTPFTGFPFLASFIAQDSFLPRQLTRRGHRLAFSNGILVLTVLASALLAVVGANVNALVPFYAIGVFTGFAMAGLGMAKYHRLHPAPRWRRKRIINAVAGAVSAVVVLIFAVVKFNEGAWLVVLLFPTGWYGLMRLNRKYRQEARALTMVTTSPMMEQGRTGRDGLVNYPRHSIVVMVDRLDLAVIRALRYARTLRPEDLRAVHIVVDSAQSAVLQQEWIDRGLAERVPLELIDCPDRRLLRATLELAHTMVVQSRTEVTMLLPRRTYPGLSGRLLHDRTADRIAAAVSKLRHVCATIVPFDTDLSEQDEQVLESFKPAGAKPTTLTDPEAFTQPPNRKPIAADVVDPVVATRTPDTSQPIGHVTVKDTVTITGLVKSVQIGSVAGRSLEVQVFDQTGGIRLLFFGRTAIAGIGCGAKIRATGRVGDFKGHLALANPRYELLP